MGQNNDYLEDSLPSAEEAEQVSLAAAMLDNDVMPHLVEHLIVDDFYHPLHRRVYEAMLGLYTAGRPIDPVLIGEEIKRISSPASLESLGGITRIGNITYGVPHFTFSAIQDYVIEIRDASIRRKAIRMFTARVNDLMQGQESVQEVMDKAEQKILALNSRAHGYTQSEDSGFIELGTVTEMIKGQFERYNQGIFTGVKTGFKPLDDMLDGGGIQRKGVYVIGGMEKSGKTSLALDIAGNVAIEQEQTAAIVTLEMSAETMGKRLYSAATGIPYYRFRPGMNDEVYTKAVEGLDTFRQYPFRIADRLFDMSQIERFATRLLEEGHKGIIPPVGVLVVDYLQLVNNDVTRATNREREVGGVSRALKKLASNLDLPIVVLSNLNREGLKEGMRPTTFNLRDSGSIGYDAESVWFVWDPAYKPGKEYVKPEITPMELIVDRQRNGPTGVIPMKFIGPNMSFMTEAQFAKAFGSHTVDNNVATNIQTAERERVVENNWDLVEDDDE